MESGAGTADRMEMIARGSDAFNKTAECLEGKSSVMNTLMYLAEEKPDGAGAVIPRIWERIHDNEDLACLDEKMDFALGVIVSGIRRDMEDVFLEALGQIVYLEDPEGYVVYFWDTFMELRERLAMFDECTELCAMIDLLTEE